MFALFSGLLGTAFSVLIRLELSAPGVQYIADNQLYNSIITAHAILMSAPLRSVGWLIFLRSLVELIQVKWLLAGGVKPHEETQTGKLELKENNRQCVVCLGLFSKLVYTMIRLTNLIHTARHKWDLLLNYTKGNRITIGYYIISLSVKFKLLLSTTQSRLKSMQKSEYKNRHNRELRDRLRVPLNVVPNNRINSGLINGDGVVIVRSILGRTTVTKNMARTLVSKAGQSLTIRGSDTNIEPTRIYEKIDIKAISNMKNLVSAYELIKSKPGNMTKGSNEETLDGLNLTALKKIQRSLRAGTFKFPPARRIQIPKPGSLESRPLTIASPRDKIVQKAIQLVMEPLYEKEFLDCSHGFRPKRGTRTALRYLEAKFQSCHYIIEADFSKAFDSIQHKKLMEILKEKIDCQKTLSLINSGLKAGYFELGELHKNLTTGTPQGSILSPLLCNIFLNKLDHYMEEIKKEFNVGTKRKKNKEYEKIANKIKYMRSKKQDISNPNLYRSLLSKLITIPSLNFDDSYVRIQYVRYADDFIVGVQGNHKLASIILDKLSTFINDNLNLQLNQSKTGIIKYSTIPVKFLGFSIMAPHKIDIDKPIEVLRIVDKSSPNTNYKTLFRRKKIRIRIYMDYNKVLNKLEINGFIRKRIRHDKHNKYEYRGTFKGNLINLDHADILNYYNSVLRGLYNYYDFIDNMNQLAYICWLITESCCLTLARKLKLRTMSKTYSKLGKDLGCNIETKEGKKRISLFKPNNFQKKHITKGTTSLIDPLKNLDKV